MKFLYGLTIALSAALLFSVEPMIARALLPQLGGSSAIWISALAFFQVALLLGYGYSALVAPASRLRPALWRAHLLLLGSAVRAVLVPPTHWLHTGAALPPQLRLFVLLTASIGLPFVTLCTTAPLLQAWYARREQSVVPYRFFALSNFASLLALLTYPTLAEPYLALHTQFLSWRVGFVLYAVLASVLTLRMRAAIDAPVASVTASAANTGRTVRQPRLLWFALPAVASMQLAAVTAHLTQDVASMPLLWVVPLAVYLLSFVLAFELPRLYRRNLVVRFLAVLLFALGYFLSLTGFNLPIGLSITFFTLELLFAAWFCHAELFALRPEDAARTTHFYLLVAAGGAVGTLLVAIVSPLVTQSNFDLPIAFLFTAGLLLAITWTQGWPHRVFWAGGTALALYLLFLLQGTYAQDALFRGRNFYGAIRVKQSQSPPQAFLSRSLYNGAIQHGMQWFSTAYRDTPLTYYTHDSGVGLALDHCCAAQTSRRIGVIGLGAGTLAAYGRPGDQLRFYEINPIVIDVAQHLFTYTRNTPSTVAIVPGDARLSLEAEPPQAFDVLIVDAFTGDSIPVHLLTEEAVRLYLRHLAPGGVIAFHISNQYLDLAPVIARLAEAERTGGGVPLQAREIDSGPDDEHGEALASWVLVSGNPSFFAQQALSVSKPVQTQANVRLWTDEQSSLLPILRWAGRHTAAH